MLVPPGSDAAAVCQLNTRRSIPTPPTHLLTTARRTRYRPPSAQCSRRSNGLNRCFARIHAPAFDLAPRPPPQPCVQKGVKLGKYTYQSARNKDVENAKRPVYTAARFRAPVPALIGQNQPINGVRRTRATLLRAHLQNICDFVQNDRIINRRRRLKGFTIGYLPHGGAQYLARPRFR